ncbi:aldo/keto reductase, partial [Salinisphaera sp. USBA-960]|nr:aldo/keto reductase [Salifodinibacter halophilus]
CRSSDTVIEAAAPLARTEVFADEVVQDLAETYEKSPAQIVLKWAVENDVVALPKSSSPEHVEQNRELFDWKLDDADHARLDERDRNHPV